jgi:glycosyltransferase involved in cell wall biosynthesis
MTQSLLSQLPPPPPHRSGWPWTEETPIPEDAAPDGGWPRISIVTPTYMQGAYIEETIRSILLQNYPSLEYIVIDGGSTDETVSILEKFSAWITTWVSEKDRGQYHAINKGFALATGDFLTFCNSDDIYLPGTFFDLARRWHDAQGYGVIVGAFQYMDGASKLDPEPRPPILKASSPIDLTLGPPGVYRLHQTSAFFLKKALDAVGCHVREDMSVTGDRELLYRVVRDFPVMLVNKSYGAFRLHAESMSVTLTLKFARQFADLALSRSTTPGENKQRRRMANYHLARGYMKYAKACGSFREGAWALIRALRHEPAYVVSPGWWKLWEQVTRGNKGQPSLGNEVQSSMEG